jgi:hypothetical protein
VAQNLEKPENPLHAWADRLCGSLSLSLALWRACGSKFGRPVGKKRNISHTMAAVRRSRWHTACFLGRVAKAHVQHAVGLRATRRSFVRTFTRLLFAHRKKLRARAPRCRLQSSFQQSPRARCVFAYAARALFFYTYDIDLGPLLHKLK